MSKMFKAFGVMLLVAAALIVVSNRLNAPSHDSLTPTLASASIPNSTSTPLLSSAQNENTPAPINLVVEATPQVEVALSIQNSDVQQPAASPTLPPNATRHVVQRGENVYRISQQYGVSMESIAALNGLVD